MDSNKISMTTKSPRIHFSLLWSCSLSTMVNESSQFWKSSANCHDVKNDSLNWSNILVPILVVLYSLVFAKIYKRHKYKLEPVHIFEMKCYIDLYILGIFGDFGFGSLKKYFLDNATLCFIINGVEIISRFSLHADTIVANIDRFLTLYWNAEYKERVDNDKAFSVLFSVKLIVIILSIILCVNYPNLLNCSLEDCAPPACSSMKQNYFYIASLPGCFTLLSIVVVTIYVVRVVLKHQSQVTPVVNISIPVISATVQGQDGKYDTLIIFVYSFFCFIL